MNKITYNLATNKDLDTLFNLSVGFEKYNQQNSTRPHEHFEGNWQDYFVEEIKKSLEDRNSWVYIAEVDSRPVGYIYSRVCEACYYYIIDELFVDPGFQGLGLGKGLLQKAIEEGLKYDYDIRTEVFEWNTNALEFYKKNKFDIDGIILKYKK